jgi:hypothetical protein
MSKKDFKEMVLFPTEDQFSQKTDELRIDVCYWTIPFYPKNRDIHIGKKIYFYDKMLNIITLRATIVGFSQDKYTGGKKAVFFELKEDDYNFRKINLNKRKIPKRKQTRGFCYKWW